MITLFLICICIRFINPSNNYDDDGGCEKAPDYLQTMTHLVNQMDNNEKSDELLGGCEKVPDYLQTMTHLVNQMDNDEKSDELLGKYGNINWWECGMNTDEHANEKSNEFTFHYENTPLQNNDFSYLLLSCITAIFVLMFDTMLKSNTFYSKINAIISMSLLLYFMSMVFEVNYALGINTWQQIGSDINGERAEDMSGWSVALSDDGTILAVGAPYHNEFVRVHQYNGISWQQIGDIFGATGDHSGYSVALSDDGTILAVGAPYNDDNGNDAGHVHVHQYNGISWQQIGSDINGEAAGDLAGHINGVALSGDGTILAVGEKGNDDAGHVRVHQYNGINWQQIGNDIDGEAAGDVSGFAGSSVALSDDGTILAVGAYGNDDNGDGAGHVRVHQYNGISWQQIGNDIDGEAVDDHSGSSVALSDDGTILAVGAPDNDANGDGAGHVRVHQYNGISWQQIGNDIDGEAAGDHSGSSVALSDDGTILAVGAHYNDDNGNIAGHVRVHQYNGISWQQIGNDIDGESAGDHSGCSVALSGDGTILAVGAYGNDDNGNKAGHVRCFDLLTVSPTTNNPTTNNPTTNNPTTSNPTTSNPTNNPTTNNPTTSNPTTNNPTTNNPTTNNPTTNNPTTSNPTTSNPTTNNPTTSNPTTNNPTTNNPTTNNPTTNNPTTNNPTTNNPTTNNPTTNNPTTNAPTTYNPTTNAPTTYNPTTNDPTTNDPTTTNPTTNDPTTNNPTTNDPTTNTLTTGIPTTFAPTTSEPIKTMYPTNSPTYRYRWLHILCFYKDRNREFLYIYVSLLQYAKYMADSLLLSIQSQQHHSTNYSKGEISSYSKWRRSGIENFKICSIFNLTIAYSQTDCPDYSGMPSSYDPGSYQYTAVGTFEFVVDDAVNAYKAYIISLMETDLFRNEFQQNMNNFLNKAINSHNRRIRRRNLLKSQAFEAIYIKIIDSLNYTTLEPVEVYTTDSDNSKDADTKSGDANSSSAVTTIIIVFVVIFILLIIVGAIYYYYRYKNKQRGDKTVNNDNHIVEMETIANAIIIGKEIVNEQNEENDDTENEENEGKETQNNNGGHLEKGLNTQNCVAIDQNEFVGEEGKNEENDFDIITSNNNVLSIPISNWKSNDISQWLNSINLSDQWKQIAMNSIKNGGFTGKDIDKVKSKKDVQNLFSIDNPMLNSRIWIEIKKIKSGGDDIVTLGGDEQISALPIASMPHQTKGNSIINADEFIVEDETYNSKGDVTEYNNADTNVFAD